MRVPGNIVALAGAGILAVATFLPVLKIDSLDLSESYWEFPDRRFGILLVALAGISTGFSVAGLFLEVWVFPFIAGALGFIAVGLTVFTPYSLAFQQWEDLGWGAYISPAGAFAIAAGAALALAGALTIDRGPAADLSRAPLYPPAGWYPDPSGRSRLRYWTGTEWSRYEKS
jgi:Protein of unknown function (DUF2510)